MLFKLTTKSIRHGPASLIRRYSRDVWQSSERTDNVSKIHQQLQHGSEACARWNSKRGIRQFEKLSNPEGFMAPSAGIFRRNISSMTLKRETVEVLHKRNFRLQMNSQRMFSSNADLPPHQEIGMPSLSPTMTEGNIARWFKKEGDQVSTGEVLCEVETDKATVEMECMEDGYLAKIVRGDGAQGIQVEEVIAVIVEEEEHLQNFKDYTPSSEASSPETTQPSEPKSEAPVEPVSQQETKTVQPSQVSSSSVKGTGGDGDIAKPGTENSSAARGKDSPAPVNKAAVGDELDYSDISHSQIRKVTASRLLMSKQTIPHYYLTVDACVDNIMELRKELNLLQEASGLKRISMNDLIIKAAALALKKVPQCNSSWMDDCIRQYHNVNINVAVQTENGLYVPVVRNADKKGLSTISEEVKQLAQKARESSLKPEDYEGGTFTVSNLGGPFGIKQFCAIVNPPQAAILAVGTAEKRVVAEGADQYKASSFMPATLSCDHRVIDGAIGAEWLKAFKGFIEDPESMLL